VLAPGVVDDFENYADATALRRNWVPQNVNTLELVRGDSGGEVGGGNSAMRVSYSFANQSYTGVGRQIQGDWSPFWDFQTWIDPDGSGNKLVLQLVAGGVAFEAYPSLAGDEPYLATIPFADWRPAPWDTANADRRLDASTLQSVTQFSVFINAVDGAHVEGSVVVDELRAVVGEPPAPVYPDVPRDHAAYEAVQWLHDAVIDLAAADGRFLPQRKVTETELAEVLEAYRPDAGPSVEAGAGAVNRAEVAMALWRIAGRPAPAASDGFDDVEDSDPHSVAVAWTTSVGVIDPVGENRFGPSRSVSRVDLARWLFRFDQVPGTAAPIVLFDFADDVQGWHTNGAGTVTAADGRLVLDLPAADWVGSFGGWNLEGRTSLQIDLPSTSGTAIKTALQLGPGWTWCEAASTGPVEGAHTDGDVVVIDLTTMTQQCRDLLGEVRGVNFYLDAGHHEIESITAR
jgi:mannan endo-1,4-beta-mannosidase